MIRPNANGQYDLNFDLAQADRTAGLAKRIWMGDVIAFVRRYVNRNAYVTPSEVRDWARRNGREPVHSAWWGGVWAKLRTMGLEPNGETETSRITSRNAARDQRWAPTEKWGSVK